MSNCMFAWPNRVDPSVLYAPVLSGGSWLAALPRTNVQDRRLRKVARSTNALVASTQFDIDQGVARDLRVFAILVPNATAAATVRFRLSNIAGNFAAPIYDSTALLILPAGLDAEQLEGMNVWKTIVAPATQNGRYIRVEIADAANPAGYVDVARVIAAPVYQPTINLAPGAGLGIEDLSTRQESDGGAATYREKAKRRVWAFTLEDEPETESMISQFDMQRIAGTTRQIHFVYNPDDTTHMHRRAFLGVMRKLSPLRMPYITSRWDSGYEIAEEL